MADLEQLNRDIKALPLAQQLRLAATLLDEGQQQLAYRIAGRAVDEMVAAHAAELLADIRRRSGM